MYDNQVQIQDNTTGVGPRRTLLKGRRERYVLIGGSRIQVDESCVLTNRLSLLCIRACLIGLCAT